MLKILSVPLDIIALTMILPYDVSSEPVSPFYGVLTIAHLSESGDELFS